MMNANDARKAAEQWILENEPENVLIPTSLIDDKDFFVFCFNSKEWLRGEVLIGLLGCGPVVLDKRDGKFYRYGSMSAKKAAIQYKKVQLEIDTIKGFFQEYDTDNIHCLRINKIYNRSRLLELFESFTLCFLQPDIDSGSVWIVRTDYNKKLLESRLEETMPISFANGEYGFPRQYLAELLAINKDEKICDCDIEIYHAIKRSTDPAMVTSLELAIVW